MGVLMGLLSGYVATKAMELVTTAMYDRQSQRDRDREKQAQPKPAFVVAAEKTFGLVGMRLDEKSAQRWGTIFHYALGGIWGVIYVYALGFTRRYGWDPVLLGLALGLVMFLLVDEAMNWAFRFSAPPDRYPMSTHLRGLVGHLAYGLALAAVVVIIFALLGVSFYGEDRL